MHVDAPTQILGCSMYLVPPPGLICSCLSPLFSCISCRFMFFILVFYSPICDIPVSAGLVKILVLFLASLRRIGLHTKLRTCSTFVRFILLPEVSSLRKEVYIHKIRRKVQARGHLPKGVDSTRRFSCALASKSINFLLCHSIQSMQEVVNLGDTVN